MGVIPCRPLSNSLFSLRLFTFWGVHAPSWLGIFVSSIGVGSFILFCTGCIPCQPLSHSLFFSFVRDCFHFEGYTKSWWGIKQAKKSERGWRRATEGWQETILYALCRVDNAVYILNRTCHVMTWIFPHLLDGTQLPFKRGQGQLKVCSVPSVWALASGWSL